jgi:transketolase
LVSYPAGFDPTVIFKGGYVLHDDPSAQVTLVATGSELGTAQEAAALLAKRGIHARLVSMPCVSLFKGQDAAYRSQVLGALPRVTVEAGETSSWAAIVGSDSLNIGVDEFGVSGPPDDLAKHFGLTAPQVAERVEKWLASKASA